MLAAADDHVGVSVAENTPIPMLWIDANDAGRLAGEEGRAAATNLNEGSVTIF
jgi:hypothetical protein